MADERAVRPDEVTCREFVEHVTDYWEDALPTLEVTLVEEHLVLCEWCANYLEQMERTVEAIGSAPEERVSEETRGALLNAFRESRGG